MTALPLHPIWQTLRPVVNAIALPLGIFAVCFIGVFFGIVCWVMVSG